MYIISSCLVGVNCRYNASGFADPELVKLVNEGKALAVCPEVLGGLSVPRIPCKIIIVDGDRRICTQSGSDYSKQFKEGALKTLKICKVIGASTAILKSRSPSCGYGKIYDGSFSGHVIDGDGVTASLLVNNGIKVYNEENWKTED